MDANRLGEALWEMHLDHMRVLERIVEASHTRGETGMILYLYHVARPMFPGELTEKLGLTTGRIANILKVLEKSGMIVRTPDTLDKRRVLVALTPRGEAFAEQANREAVEYHARLLSQLDEGEAEAFLNMIKRMVDALDIDSVEQSQA